MIIQRLAKCDLSDFSCDRTDFSCGRIRNRVFDRCAIACLCALILPYIFLYLIFHLTRRSVVPCRAGCCYVRPWLVLPALLRLLRVTRYEALCLLLAMRLRKICIEPCETCERAVYCAET